MIKKNYIFNFVTGDYMAKNENENGIPLLPDAGWNPPFWHFLVKSGCRIMEGMWITFTFITIWRSVSATVAKESWC